MAKLTDTQLVILSTASRRNDRGVDLPTSVTGEALRKAWISSSALGCWKRSAPTAWLGDAMRKLDPWRFRITKQFLEAIGVKNCGGRSYGDKR
jgi:hypothetical protein